MHVFSRTQAEEKTWHVRCSTLQVQFYRSVKELLIRGHTIEHVLPLPATCARSPWIGIYRLGGRESHNRRVIPARLFIHRS